MSLGMFPNKGILGFLGGLWFKGVRFCGLGPKLLGLEALESQRIKSP